jgi:hypothetical protein
MATKIQLRITGTETLIMHSSRLSDPTDELARAMKKISAKRSKSIEDYEEMAHMEFLGSLYHHPDAGVYLPGDNVARCLLDAARKRKLGTKVASGVIVTSSFNELEYSKPTKPKDIKKADWDALPLPEQLWASGAEYRHKASVKVQTSRVMRTRPMFQTRKEDTWSTTVDIDLDTEILDVDDFVQIADIAGSQIGLGDWRPRYGRFQSLVTVL